MNIYSCITISLIIFNQMIYKVRRKIIMLYNNEYYVNKFIMHFCSLVETYPIELGIKLFSALEQFISMKCTYVY